MASLKLCVCFWPWAFIQLNIQIPRKKKKRRLTPVLHLSPLGVKKKMNVAMNSVHLQTNGLTLPPPSLSCPLLITPFVHFYELKHAHTLAHTGNPAH